jgi:hypothetical protein
MDSSKKDRKTDDSAPVALNGAPVSSEDDYRLRELISPPPSGAPDVAPPNNIRDTKAWRASKKGLGRIWSNYKTTLSTAFKSLGRDDQEALVQKLCVIVTLGVACLGLLMFYGVVPMFGRVFGVPAALFGAYWAGNKIVTPVVLARIEDMLNKE